MTLYKIRNWSALFENNRTKELKKLGWVPIPNKQDGDGYTQIMERVDGPAIFGAWIACVQIASGCDPRGTLLRDGGKPHDAQSLARMSRMPAALMRDALGLLSEPDINWLESTPYGDTAQDCDNPATPCDNPAIGCPERTNERTKEGNEKNENTIRGIALDEAKAKKALSLVNLMDDCAKVLGEAEMKQCHSRWLFRAETEPEKLERIMADTGLAAREGRIKTTAAQYAEDAWKRFQ